MTRLPLFALLLASAAPVAALADPISLTDPGTIGGGNGSVRVLATTDGFGNTVFFSSDYAFAYGVSGNGTTLFGAASTASGAAHAFTWTAGGGFTDLGALPGGTHASLATAATPTASTVVGFSEVTGGGWHAYKWTASGGMVDLGTIDNSEFSAAWGVSADGAVIVGGSFTATTIDRAARWTQTGGWQNLGTLTGGGFSDAFGVNADGSVVVGESTSSDAANVHAFRWTAGGGMADLGTIGGVSGSSVAAAVDSDGGVVVGIAASATGHHAFRWTQSGGMADLGVLNGGTRSTAFGVNSDGSVIVGSSDGVAGTHAFVWTNPTGMVDLNNLLSAGGVDMTGVSLSTARGVSSDGSIVAGSGIFPGHTNSTHAFLARITQGSAGVTTPGSVVQSITALVDSHQAQMVTQQLTGDVYLGKNEQLSCGDCGGAYASVGSFNFSLHGRHSLNDEWTVLGGIGYGKYDSKGVSVTRSLDVALSLRFDPDMGPSRPFFEIGGSAAPFQEVRYSRTYDNGAGTATGSGTAHSSFASGFIRAGWIDRLSPLDEIGGAVTLARTNQTQSGYAEAVGSTNPFDAIFTQGTDSANFASGSVQATHLFFGRIETTLNFAVSSSFGSHSGVHASVTGLGAVPVSAHELTVYEPGLRLGYRLDDNFTLEGFVDASIGPGAVGASPHGGIGISTNF
jgi:probable HAF family extracellular repeat protein